MSEQRFEPLDFRSEELDQAPRREDWIGPLGDGPSEKRRVPAFEPGFHGTRDETPAPEPEEAAPAALRPSASAAA